MMKLTVSLASMLASSSATATATAESRCNPELQLLEQPGVGLVQDQHPLGGEATYGAAQLHTLPLEGDSGPACLDGTPYGFYFQPSTTGSTKWTVSIDGTSVCILPVRLLCNFAYVAAVAFGRWWLVLR